MKNDVIVLENNVNAIKKELRQETLQRAAMAGGIVISNNAKINISRTFKKVSGSRGLSRIVIEETKSSESEAWVAVGPTVVYGRIHEFGGIIRPVKAKMLSWVDDAGKRIFANIVHMPARPYLRPAVDNHKEEIKQGVASAIAEGISKVT